MKNFKLVTIVLITIIGLVSCGEKVKKKKVEEKSIALEVESKMSGALSKNFKVVNAVLKTSPKVFGSRLLVEVERTSNKFSFNSKKSQVCGTQEVGKIYTYCISADILDELGMPLDTNLDIYGRSSFEKCISLNEGETIWLEFSLGYKTELKENPDKAKKVKLTSSLEKGDGTISSFDNDKDINDSKKIVNNSNQKEWDEALDSYEKYIDNYIKLMKKSKAGDMSALSEYPKMMEQANKFSDKLNNAKGDLTAAQMSRYMKLQTKLSTAAMDM